jgi:phosphotransferase system HPr-like phosphotransfer protein
MSHDLQVSDDVVLAVICLLGANARVDTVRHALAERLTAEVSLASTAGRLRCLREAGLVRVVARGVAEDDQVRLTAVGVERLRALQREPLTPPTDFKQSIDT